MSRITYFVDKILDYIAIKLRNPLKAEVYGYCPVQAEGKLPDGNYFYFRSRGSSWFFGVGKSEWEAVGGKIWSFREKEYLPWPHAGYISRRETLKLIKKAYKLYKQWLTKQ